MKTIAFVAAGLLFLLVSTVDAQIDVEGCVTVGGTCEYEASTSGSIAAQGTWKVEIWWNTTCDAKDEPNPSWIVASDSGSPSNPGDGNNGIPGVAGYWEGSITGDYPVSCARATALDQRSSVAIGNFPALPQP